jgi:hypothetical protein
MSATVSRRIPPSRADASFIFGVTMLAMGRSSSLHSRTRNLKLLQISNIKVHRAKKMKKKKTKQLSIS